MAGEAAHLWRGLVLAAAVLACPMTVTAQPQQETTQAEPAPLVLPAIDPAALDADIANILEQVETLAEALDLDTPVIDREPLAQALRAAVPTRSEETPAWGHSLFFEFNTHLVTGGDLTADADGHVVLTDARGCQTANAGEIEIVHFRRFVQDGLRGHQCVVTGLRDDIWLLNSTTVAEGPDRRLTAFHTMAVAVEGDPQAAHSTGEAVLDANITLSQQLAGYGLALLAMAEQQRPLDAPAVVERIGRAVEALDAAGD